jgi:hypothetical protein
MSDREICSDDETCGSCKCESCARKYEAEGTPCSTCEKMWDFMGHIKEVLNLKQLPQSAILQKCSLYKFKSEIR